MTSEVMRSQFSPCYRFYNLKLIRMSSHTPSKLTGFAVEVVNGLRGREVNIMILQLSLESQDDQNEWSNIPKSQ